MGLLKRLMAFFSGANELHDPNAHIREYLRYYLSVPEAPNFAVMLTGPWGGGKTHLTKNLMRELHEAGTKHVYVSLYGVRTREEFDRAVLAALYPVITNRAAKAATQLIGALLSTVRINMKISAEEYLDKFDADLFVFDDLERAEMSAAAVLGYINPFVEHGGCKVIVLANEAEIKEAERADYKRRKEKVIGQTLALKPDLERALPAFKDRISNKEVRDFLTANMRTVQLVSEQSGYGNLRILQQSLWDFTRFYEALPEAYRTKSEGIQSLLGPFLAFATEFKAGVLNADKLQGRTLVARVLSASSNNPIPNPFKDTADKYVGVDLDDNLLSDDLLIEIFERGAFRTETIRASLERSPLFTSPAQIPSWRIVWDKELCEDDRVAAAINDMEAKFAAREYTDQGEILHVLGLRLRLIEDGLLAIDRSHALAQGKAYIDDLERKGRLAPLVSTSFSSWDFTSFGGLGFNEKDSEEFKELLRYLLERQEAVLNAGYPAQARELLKEMVSDDGLFWRRINYSNTQDTRYARTPIFKYVTPQEFIDALSTLSPSRQRSALMALQNRYDGGQLARDLKDERPWLEQVRTALLEKAAKSEPIAKNRITRVVGWTIGKALKEIEAADIEAAEYEAAASAG